MAMAHPISESLLCSVEVRSFLRRFLVWTSVQIAFERAGSGDITSCDHYFDLLMSAPHEPFFYLISCECI
jgi:hypothetical protein